MDRTVKKGKRMKVHEKATRKVKKEQEKEEKKTEIAIKVDKDKFRIFDYTVWQREYFDKMQPGEFTANAAAYAKSHPYTGKGQIL